MMDDTEARVLEAARQVAATYHPDMPAVTVEFRARLLTLRFAVRALDRREVVARRLRDADIGDCCHCPDHRYT